MPDLFCLTEKRYYTVTLFKLCIPGRDYSSLSIIIRSGFVAVSQKPDHYFEIKMFTW